MKKTVKVLSLLFVAAALFMGCKQNVEEPAPAPSIDGELFSEDEVTVPATNGIELSDGKWTFRAINKSDDSSISSMAGELIFNAKNGSIDQTSEDLTFKCSMKGTIPEGATEAELAKAKEEGYTIDGNSYSIYKEFDYQSLIEYLQENIDESGDSDDPIASWAMFMTSAVSNPSRAPGSWKTNSDKTKFFSEQADEEEGSTMTYYFAKN